MTINDDDPPMVAVTVTCHTEDCGNAGAAIALIIPEGGGVQCGVCGQPITDVVPDTPADPT